MKIQVAKEAGFCFGVKRALEMADEASENQSLMTYGELIHNKQVVERLAQKNITAIDTLEGFQADVLMIRSHGVGKAFYDEALQRKIPLLDGTCPFVKKIHKIVNDFSTRGYSIVIVGDRLHPEVIGIAGWSSSPAWIANSLEEAREIPVLDQVCLVAQTTITLDKWQAVHDQVSESAREVVAFNTICSATQKRQASAEALSAKMDVMLVVGGRHSSNTVKLYEVCSRNCKKTYHIETSDEIKMINFNICDKIGITAGASTPDWIINEIILELEKIEGEVLLMDNISMAQFMDQIDQGMRVPKRGHVIKGKIVQVTDNSLVVNVGYKSDGIVPLDEITSGASNDVLSGFQEDQELDVYVIKTDDGEGNVLLSLKRVTMDADWTELEKLYASEEIFEVKVTEAVKGGVVAYYKEVRGFIPASQLSVRFVDDLRSFVNKNLQVKVVEFSRERRRAVFSHKVVMQAELATKKTAVWEKAIVGAVLEGEVKRITNFGAFVDLGGIDGMIHVSELTWGRIKTPQEAVKIGQMVSVKVIAADKTKEKISLSIKQLNNDPWAEFANKYEVGGVYEGKVVNLTDFGAFVELEPGVEGLVHVSHISRKRVEKPADELKVGDVRNVKLLEVDADTKKVKLSIKEAEAPAETDAEAPVEE